MLKVTLYMREDCQLCIKVEEYLERLQEKYPHKLIQVDIEENELTEFVEKIPVIEVGPYQIQAPIDLQKLEMTLGAAQDRLDQIEKIDAISHQKKVNRGAKVSFADRLFYWLSKRYMVVFNGFVFAFVGLAFLAPILQSNGNTTPAQLIYSVYGRLCHQLAYRSWFIYGDQIAYPREEAQVDGLRTYSQATGQDPLDINGAVSYLGNRIIGYKTALCQRDIAIYTGILLFGLIFTITRRKIPGLPIGIWFLLGIIPIGLDGVSQIVSQLPWDIIPIRESTPFLRSLTGGLFGFSTAWFGYPIVEESMADTRKLLTVKMKASQVENSE
jgi:uncharacterized membrane protein